MRIRPAAATSRVPLGGCSVIARLIRLWAKASPDGVAPIAKLLVSSASISRQDSLRVTASPVAANVGRRRQPRQDVAVCHHGRSIIKVRRGFALANPDAGGGMQAMLTRPGGLALGLLGGAATDALIP